MVIIYLVRRILISFNQMRGLIFLLSFSCIHASAQQTAVFRKAGVPVETRVKDLLNKLTLEEKISLLGYRSKAIPRLQIPEYNWWNEALHGVARAGEATVFPQAIALAATFAPDLIQKIADVISTEARAKYNLAIASDRRVQYMGLSFWSPNINIFRDPRWGRGQETYGEDPFLTATIGSAFVKGMQGNRPVYLKTAACAKHFAVHSGPEAGRHSFNALVDEKDLRETYLYAFRKLVDSRVEAVMCAYNRVNDMPCCTNDSLLRKILREEWDFKGHVVTDCWALQDIWKEHRVMNNNVEVAAAAVKAGINLDCSNMLQDDLIKAFHQKLITEAEIDSALSGILRTRFKLGLFDENSRSPFARLGSGNIHTPEHIDLARKAAQKSMVLLKNDKGLLPLKPGQYRSIMILGPNAGSLDVLIANYHGMSGNLVTFAEGITAAAGAATVVQYDQGSDYTDTVRFGGLWAAGESDISIAVIGLTPVLEGEEGDAFLAAHGGDRSNLDLPAAHIKFLKELRKKNKPVVVVVTGGSAIDIAAIEPYADAIIFAWYPGEQGGTALADIILGRVSPSGRLPVTFYKSLNQLPSYENYAMKGRTYRYFSGEVQYPFGFGLSYTSFSYKQGKLRHAKDTVHVSAIIKNTGNMDADEVVQVYVEYPAIERMPIKELKAFKRVHIRRGTEKIVNFSIAVSDLAKWDINEKKWKVYPGEYRFRIGPNSGDLVLEYSFRN
jgi:beta-glucosidase